MKNDRKMKPILDLFQTRQLNFRPSLAQLPDDRLEKMFSKVSWFRKINKSAPQNTVRNQHRKQLIAVTHQAPQNMRNTWLTDWAKLAVNDSTWRKFMRKVGKWQDEEEIKRGIRLSMRKWTLWNWNSSMARQSAPTVHTRSGLAVHFARYCQMNDAQRAKKTAARKREAGRIKTDLSVRLGRAKIHPNEPASNTPEIDSDHKKCESSASHVERRANFHTASTTSVFSGRNGSEKNQDDGGGVNSFRGKVEDWLQDENRCCDRPPPQHSMDRTCEGDTCSTCSKCVRCKLGLCTGRRWEKDFGGCRKCIHCVRCVACWSDEDSEIFQLHEQSVADIPKTLEFDGSSETTNLVSSALGVDLSFNVMCQFIGSFA